MAKKSKNKKKRNNLPVLAIVAIILLIVLILVFNKNFVNGAKEKFKKLPQNIAKVENVENNSESSNEENSAKENKVEEKKLEEIDIKFTDEKKEKKENQNIVIDLKENKREEKKISVDEIEQQRNDEIRKSLNTTKTKKKLYFIKYNDSDQGYVLQAVTRTITYQDSILTQTLSILMYGPNGSEINSELATLIQPQTKLLSVRISDGVAYLNFNEDFMYHEFGQEGFITQLKQFVFTATEFATVDSVQILINGKIVDYTPESVEISKPFTRNSF